MPWLITKICDFLREDMAASLGAEMVVDIGLIEA